MAHNFVSNSQDMSAHAASLLQLVDRLFVESENQSTATACLQAFADGLLEVTASRGAAIYLNDTKSYPAKTVTAVADGVPSEQWWCESDNQTDIDSFIAKVLQVPGVVVCGDDQHERDCICNDLPFAENGINTQIVIPITAGQQKFGALFLAGRSGGYEKSLSMMLSFTCQSLASKLISSNEQLRRINTEQAADNYDRNYQALVDSSLDCIITIDINGLILEFNAAAEITFGWRKDEVLNRNITEVLFPDQDRIDSYEAKRQSNKSTSLIDEDLYIGKMFETEARRKNGQIFPLEITYTKLWLDGQLQLTSLSRDITERKRQIKDLQATKDKAESSCKEKSTLVATVSHELRAPLNAVRGALGLFEQAGLTKRERELMQIAQGSTEDLLTIVDDLLDFSKIEAGKFRLEIDDARPTHIISGIVKLMGLRAQQQRVAISIYIDPKIPEIVRTDSGRVRQVLINLLENAIRNTADGNITILLEHYAEDWLRFSVTDDGPGISEQMQAELFRDFSQADNPGNGGVRGSGLGLSISKRIAQQLGGDIGLKSSLGEGCNFWFSIPLDSRSPNQLQPGANGELGDLIILFISDRTRETLGICKQLLAWNMSARFVRSIDQFADSRLDDRLVDQVDLVILCLPIVSSEQEALVAARCRQIGARSLRLYSGGQTVNSNETSLLEIELHSPVVTTELYRCLHKVSKIRPETNSQHKPKLKKMKSYWDFRGVRLLLAEDSLANARVAAVIIEQFGMVVDHVMNGQAAVDAIQNTNYDIVIMDINMPELDGLAATRMIRSLPEKCSQIPILGISSEAGPEVENECRQAGMNAFMNRLGERNHFMDILEKLLVENGSHHDNNSKEPKLVPVDLRRREDWIDNEAFDRLARETSSNAMPHMVDVFVNELLQQAEIAAIAVKDVDISSLQKVSHIMKSSAQTFGAHRVSNLAVKLNSACKRNDTESALSLTGILLNAIAPSIRALESACNSPDHRMH